MTRGSVVDGSSETVCDDVVSVVETSFANTDLFPEEHRNTVEIRGDVTLRL